MGRCNCHARKKKKKTFVLPPMCICSKPPVKLSLQVRKAIGPWEMPDQTAGKQEGSSGKKYSSTKNFSGLLEEGQSPLPSEIAWLFPPSQLLWLSAEGDKKHNKPGPLQGLKEPRWVQHLLPPKGKEEEEEEEYTQPGTSQPIPLAGEFSDKGSTCISSY